MFTGTIDEVIKMQLQHRQQQSHYDEKKESWYTGPKLLKEISVHNSSEDNRNAKDVVNI